MGLRDFLRKYNKRVDTSPCPTVNGKSGMEQQQNDNSTGIRSLDLNAPA
jgi:hypothetical protein